MAYELTTQPPIDLGNLYVFRFLLEKAEEEAKHHNALLEQVDKIAEMYGSHYQGLLEEIADLRLQIRLETRGVPVTEPYDAISEITENAARQQMSEEQYNTQSQLLKKAYQKVAPLVHPDRGGTVELFKAAKAAYSTRNLQALYDMYTRHKKMRSLHWQQSPEGIEFAYTQFQIPQRQLQLLQQTPNFAVARHHMSGNPMAADVAMFTKLHNDRLTLQTELTAIRSKNYENHSSQKDSDESRTIDINQGSEETGSEQRGAIAQEAGGCSIENNGS